MKRLWNFVRNWLLSATPSTIPSTSNRLTPVLIAGGLGVVLGIFIGRQLTPSLPVATVPPPYVVSSDSTLQLQLRQLQIKLHQTHETLIDLREQRALDSVRRMSELEAMRTINERYQKR
ncbi:hypothetical protein [Runella zeae]|uniref:hypothetical protein n=1 Tax=Runella zeae TaxID=94255 RepID=UPI002352E5C4|nr:hypothetical protein [Runella zeae]